jgi:hypothetical protein
VRRLADCLTSLYKRVSGLTWIVIFKYFPTLKQNPLKKPRKEWQAPRMKSRLKVIKAKPS